LDGTLLDNHNRDSNVDKSRAANGERATSSSITVTSANRSPPSPKKSKLFISIPLYHLPPKSHLRSHHPVSALATPLLIFKQPGRPSTLPVPFSFLRRQKPQYQSQTKEPLMAETTSNISAAQLAANRSNSQHSTGPTTPEGKKKISLNAVKTALTGRTVLLPQDDADAYEALLHSYVKEFQPVGPVETGLVQSLVDVCWRLDRIPGLEYALLTWGRMQIEVEDPNSLNLPALLLEMRIRGTREKEFRNLQLQESRLTRRREKEMKELLALQTARKAKEAEELKRAAKAALIAKQRNQTFDLAANGFEFSNERFAAYMAQLTPAAKQNLLKEALQTMEAAA
jgi:hypothetical protein